MNEIPKPASPLPWRAENWTDLLDAKGGEVAYAYPNEGGGFANENDAVYAAWAANNALKLYEALEKAEAALGTWAESCGMGWQYAEKARAPLRQVLKAARGEK